MAIRIVSLIGFLFCGFFLNAQEPPSFDTGMSPNGSMQGRTYEASNKEALPFISILLLQLEKDSIIHGAISDENGYFILENVPYGTYRLKATSIGYDPLVKVVRLDASKLEIGDLYLKTSESLLQTVTITAEKSAIELHPDKKVINVEKDISAKGGTALDALKNAPGVTVNEDDEVLLRNNAPIIYVDGKPTTLTMRQIPADQISTIEIITNPSAKYDASATGGIINIKLKENKRPGYNGMFNIGLGTNDQLSGMASLNIKETKWAANLSYNFNMANNDVDGISDRDNFNDGIYSGGSYQDVTTIFNRQFQFGRLGFDYFINNRNTISLSQNLVDGKFGLDETQATSELDKYYNLFAYSIRDNEQDIHFTNYAASLSFKHTYPIQDKQYTASVSYSRNHGNNHYDYMTNNYDSTGALIPFNPELQLIEVNNFTDVLTAQYDFENPLDENNNLDFGFKANWSSSSSDQDASNYVYPAADYEIDSVLTTKYNTDEIILAAYTSYAGKIRNVSYQAGLRLESSNFYVGYNDTGKFNYNYPSSIKDLHYALFPSINLSYKLNGNNEFQFNASRKISRPNMFQASPFLFASDKYNYRLGNPLLKPEFVNLVELVHNYQNNSINLLTTLYGRYNEQPITPYSYFLDSTQQILVNTFANADHGYSYGLEPSLSFTKIKNLSVNYSANIFYTHTGDIGEEVQGNDGWSWDNKINLGYKFPKQFTLQLNGNYEAPKYIPQGRILAMYGADISLSKEIHNWTAALSLNDIFDTREMRIEYDQPDYYQIQTRRRDTRFLRLTVSYRFGKMDNSLFRGKSNDAPPTNSNDGY